MRELVERLPEGCRLTGEALILPDKTQVDFGAAPADDQFAEIFRSSCRQPPTEEELATIGTGDFDRGCSEESDWFEGCADPVVSRGRCSRAAYAGGEERRGQAGADA